MMPGPTICWVLLGWVSGVEGHVRLLLVLAEPAHQVGVGGAVGVLVEDRNN